MTGQTARRLTVQALVGLALAAGAAAEDRGEERGTPRFAATTEVLASRLLDDPAATGRREVVVTREEIARLPVTTVPELLALLPGVGLARRGARGVQGDLGLRGGTFEQALVLVDGVRVSNPQTGHHDLDLFVPLAAVERVEVLYGPASAVHGPDAFGGAVNIVTGVDRPSAFARAGDHHLAGGGLAGKVGEAWAAAEREVHTGFRDNTEADTNAAAAGWSWSGEGASAKIATAAGRRRFGAFRFYSLAYPDQRQWTDGALLAASGRAALGRLELRAAARLDQHHDDFVLDRARPEWYHNRHRTRGALLDLALAGQAAGLDWVAGGEVSRDRVESSSLGDHARSRAALFAELGRGRPRSSWGVQARWDRQEPWGSVTTVAGGAGWAVGGGARLSAHLGESFRAPSFTELYYDSPSTVGNPELEPERGWTADLGLERGPWSVTLFGRRSDRLVDYLLADDGVWRATNLGRVDTAGLEAALLLPAWRALAWQRLGLAWLGSEVDVDPERSAYALAHPELEATWSGAATLPWQLELGWGWRFRVPQEGGSWAALDLRLARPLGHGLALALEAGNAFDRELAELHGVPLPGRWLSLTLSWQGASAGAAPAQSPPTASTAPLE